MWGACKLPSVKPSSDVSAHGLLSWALLLPVSHVCTQTHTRTCMHTHTHTHGHCCCLFHICAHRRTRARARACTHTHTHTTHTTHTNTHAWASCCVCAGGCPGQAGLRPPGAACEADGADRKEGARHGPVGSAAGVCDCVCMRVLCMCMCVCVCVDWGGRQNVRGEMAAAVLRPNRCKFLERLGW